MNLDNPEEHGLGWKEDVNEVLSELDDCYFRDSDDENDLYDNMEIKKDDSEFPDNQFLWHQVVFKTLSVRNLMVEFEEFMEERQ